MTPTRDGRPPPVSAALRAAARLARDARFTVSMVLRSSPDEVMLAAAEAGVDVTIAHFDEGVVAQFVPRHGDRHDRAVDMKALARFRPVEAGGLDAPAAPEPAASARPEPVSPRGPRRRGRGSPPLNDRAPGPTSAEARRPRSWTTSAGSSGICARARASGALASR